MDATRAIQDSIHVFSLVRKYVSRILGTYHCARCRLHFIDLRLRPNSGIQIQIHHHLT